MDIKYLGELAALGTSLFFTFGSILFTQASRQVGALVLNRTRLVFALVLLSLVLWGVTALHGQVRPTLRTLETHPGAVGFAFLGAVTGPFLGVSLSLLAIQHAPVGIASTLMALPPILLLPVSHYFYKERIGWQAIAGTLLAIAGIAMLFLV